MSKQHARILVMGLTANAIPDLKATAIIVMISTSVKMIIHVLVFLIVSIIMVVTLVSVKPDLLVSKFKLKAIEQLKYLSFI